MAEGDLVIFEGALEEALENWVGTDELFCAVLDPTTTPAQDDASPELGDYTEVGTGGNYTAGGLSLGTWANFVSFLAKVTTLDSTTNPLWAQDAGNDTDARWLLIYNGTQAGDPAFAFVDLGANKDMSAGDLAATWNVNGIATFTLP